MSTTTDLSQLLPGFADTSRDSQSAFRQILDAMSRPGRVQTLTQLAEVPQGLSRATAIVALTLLDFETPVWLDPALRGREAQTWLRFHCGCPLVEDAAQASFAIVVKLANMPPLNQFNRGDDKYPDRSTTLIVQVESLSDGPVMRIRGPGIQREEQVRARPLPEDFWMQMHDNGKDFQLGVDLMLTAGDQLLGLPRTIQTPAAASAANNTVETV